MIFVFFLGLTLAAGGASAGGFVTYFEHYEDATNFSDVRAVVITSDGAFVIAGAYTGAVTTMSRNTETGALTWVETIPDVGYVGAAVLSPDNRHLYIATGYNDSVAVYSRDLGTGALTYVDEYIDGADGVDGLELAVSIDISADGKHVYAGGATDDGLAVFSRDPGTGALTFVEVHFDDVGGVDGLDQPRSVFVAPGGVHVYVVAATDDAIAIFSRDSTTGELTWLGQVTDADDGVSGLNGVFRVTGDPAGNHIYTSGADIAVFARDAGTGLLTYVEDHTLAFSRAIDLDRTGRRLYAISETGDTISVFERNLATGSLTLSFTATNEVDGVAGMDGPYSMALDPQSHSAYVGTVNDTLAVFKIGIFRDGFESGDQSSW